MPFPFTKQPDAMDCGPACLRMIAAHYGKRYMLERLRYAARVANIAGYIEVSCPKITRTWRRRSYDISDTPPRKPGSLARRRDISVPSLPFHWADISSVPAPPRSSRC